MCRNLRSMAHKRAYVQLAFELDVLFWGRGKSSGSCRSCCHSYAASPELRPYGDPTQAAGTVKSGGTRDRGRNRISPKRLARNATPEPLFGAPTRLTAGSSDRGLARDHAQDMHEGSYPAWAETRLMRLRAQPRAWSVPRR